MTRKEVLERRALTIEQYAKALQICQKTVRRGVANGDIPHVRIGRSIRIPVTALDKILQEAG